MNAPAGTARAADGTWQAASFAGSDAPRRLAPGLAALAVSLAVLLACFYRGGAGEEGVVLALAAAGLAVAVGLLAVPAWRQPLRPRAVDVCVAAAAAWMLAQQGWNPAVHAGMVSLVVLGGACAVYLAARLAGAGGAFWPLSMAAVGVIATGAALWSLAARALDPGRGVPLFLDINNLAAFFNLVAFGLAAWFAASPRPGRVLPALRVACCTLLCVAALGTGSRGALLGLISGLIVTFALARAQWRGRHAMVIAALAAAAIVATLVAFALADGQGDLLSRLAQGGASVAGQMTGRTELWDAGMRMLAAAPWRGNGLGTWWLLYPPLRAAGDETTGFHAHNDYLELAAEGGWPLVALLGAGLVLGVQAARAAARRGGATAETAWLAGGLAALLVHSVFNFNLIVAPIPWIAALLAARLVNLADGTASARALPAAAGRAGLAAALAATLVVTAYAAASAAGGVLYQAGREVHARGQAEAAAVLFARAARWAPWQDTILIAHADLLFRVATETEPGARTRLIAAARAELERAAAANPYKPHTAVLRGHLFLIDPEVPAPLRGPAAEVEYRRALALEPAYVEAVHGLARLWMEAGRHAEAADLLAAAPTRYRGQTIDMAARLTLTAHALVRAGRTDAALTAAAQAAAARADGRGAAFLAAFRRAYNLPAAAGAP